MCTVISFVKCTYMYIAYRRANVNGNRNVSVEINVKKKQENSFQFCIR